MKKLLIHCKRCAVLLLALTAAFAVGCTGDLEDEIKDLNDKYDAMSEVVEELENGIHVSSIEGNTITFTDGTQLEIDELKILDENDQFYVLSAQGETCVAYKANVVFPSNVSLSRTSVVKPVLVKDQEFGFYVEVNPDAFTVMPSNLYIVAYKQNVDVKAVTKGESILVGESAGETIHGDYELFRLKATDLEEGDNGSYIARGVWTSSEYGFGEDQNTPAFGNSAPALELDKEYKIYLSLEYPKYVWDEAEQKAVRGYKYILSDDAFGYYENYVSIKQSDVKPEPISLHFTEGEGQAEVKDNAKYMINALDVESLFLNDFISGNLSDDGGVRVLNANKVEIGSGSGKNIDELNGILMGDDPQSLSTEFKWSDAGKYTNTSGQNAKLFFEAPLTNTSSRGLFGQDEATYTCDASGCQEQTIKSLKFKGYLAFVDRTDAAAQYKHAEYPVLTVKGSKEGDANYTLADLKYTEDYNNHKKGESIYPISAADAAAIALDVEKIGLAKGTKIEQLENADEEPLFYHNEYKTTYSAYIAGETGKNAVKNTDHLFNEESFSGVARDLTIYVHDVDTLVMRQEVKALLPSTADGAVATIEYDSYDDEKSLEEKDNYDSDYNNVSYVPAGFHGTDGEFNITYTPSVSQIYYEPDGAKYGYVVGQDEEKFVEYLNSDATLASFISTSVVANEHHKDAVDVNCDIKLANTASQPLLPGAYTIVSTVDMTYTDADGVEVYVGKKVFGQLIELYAPQFTVELASTVLPVVDQTNNVNSIVGGAKGVENMYPKKLGGTSANKDLMNFTTYEWYDFDLARLVDVMTVDSWVNLYEDADGLYYDNDKTTVDEDEMVEMLYSLEENNITSTLYTDAALALYDYNAEGAYVGARFFEKDAVATKPAGVATPWLTTLSIAVEGQETLSNLIEVAPLAAGSKDVVKKITMYQTLKSGLKIPVQLIERRAKTAEARTFEAVVPAEDMGEMMVSIKVNRILKNKLNADKNGVVADGDTASAALNEYADLNEGAIANNKIDYNDMLGSTYEANPSYQITLEDGQINRVAPTYLNSLKESFNFSKANDNYLAALNNSLTVADDYYVMSGKKIFGSNAFNPDNAYLADALYSFSTGVQLTNRAFSDNRTETVLTEEYKQFIVAQCKVNVTYREIATVADFDALSLVNQYTVLYYVDGVRMNSGVTKPSLESYSQVDFSGSAYVGACTVEAAGELKAAQVESQIGDGSADRSTTVNLIASKSFEVGKMTYEGGAALADNSPLKDVDLITIDANGYVHAATVDAATTNKYYEVPVIVCVTDVAGNKNYSVVPVVIYY